MAALGVALHPDLADGRRDEPITGQLGHVLLGTTTSRRPAERAKFAVPAQLPLRARTLVRLVVEDGQVGLRVVTSAAAAASVPDLYEYCLSGE